MENKTIKSFIEMIRKSDTARSLIPMEFVSGLPILTIRKGEICITIPYYKVKIQPEDKTLIYPLAYSITALWSNGTIIDYKNFNFVPEMKKLDFSKPIGTFRHEAIKQLNKQQYLELKNELFTCYDEYLICITQKKAFAGSKRMKQLFSILMEPCQKPMYMLVGKKFFQEFLDFQQK
jgi:hypothetical protein